MIKVNNQGKIEPRVIITNGSGTSGKDTFAKMIGERIPTMKCSSVDRIKELASLGGYDGGKTEKDRKFLSDLKMLFTEYNDMPFCDISKLVDDFKAGKLDCKLLMIDIREPNEIERAKRAFGAVTVLIRNINVKPITTNVADACVEYYTYDYVIDNSGTLQSLECKADDFIEWLQIEECRQMKFEGF